MRIKAGLVCLVLVSKANLCLAQYVFSTKGDATMLTQDCYQLTSDTTFLFGSIWSKTSIDLSNAFDLKFAVNLGCKSDGGEGLAFVLQAAPDSTHAVGCPGERLGFGVPPAGLRCKPIKPSLAVEIDTRENKNVPVSDINVDHLSLVRDGNQAQPLMPPVRASTKSSNINDCEFHEFRITWKPSTRELKVYFDGELKIVYIKDLQNEIFPGKKNLFFGFTSATGARPNVHVVCANQLILEVDADFYNKNAFEQGVGIYTNPSTEQIIVDVKFDITRNIKIQLFNVRGEVVRTIDEKYVRDAKYRINLPGLPQGIYYLKVSDGKSVKTRKIIHLAIRRA